MAGKVKQCVNLQVQCYSILWLVKLSNVSTCKYSATVFYGW